MDDEYYEINQNDTDNYTGHDDNDQPKVKLSEQDLKNREIFKKWIQTKAGGRFCTLSIWPEGFKMIVDLGQTTSDSKLDSNVKLFCDLAQIYTYLEAVKLGTADKLFPLEEKSDKTYYDSFVSYGGGMGKDGKPVSRILKIQTDSEERNTYLWKGGMFVGRKTGTGAILPDFQQKIAESSIMLSRVDMCNVANIVLLRKLYSVNGS